MARAMEFDSEIFSELASDRQPEEAKRFRNGTTQNSFMNTTTASSMSFIPHTLNPYKD